MRLTAGCNMTTHPHLFSLFPDDSKKTERFMFFNKTLYKPHLQTNQSEIPYIWYMGAKFYESKGAVEES